VLLGVSQDAGAALLRIEQLMCQHRMLLRLALLHNPAPLFEAAACNLATLRYEQPSEAHMR
jgi:hypothetical protein